MVKAKASKDSRKTHGAEKKGDIFYIDPEKLTLVTDPEVGRVRQARARRAEEKFILNIMHYGVQTPIKVRQEHGDGRRPRSSGAADGPRHCACEQATHHARRGAEAHAVRRCRSAQAAPGCAA